MNVFAVGTEFIDVASVFEAKKKYEEASLTLLSISACHKLKTSDDVSKRCVYDRLEFSCKAGHERKSGSKGFRESSTYKMGCPVKVNILFNGTKLVVKKAELNHENHLMNQQVYDHYPENLRLTEDDIAAAEKMVKVDGNKKKIKMFLQNKRRKPVPMKLIHNLQTKINSMVQGVSENILETLFTALSAVPGSRSRFISNEDNEFIGIFYQDQRMVQLYDAYPEIVLYDATYKLNNHELPLFIQCIIDGNGETEIASLYICRSESREGIGAMLDVFKEFNANWSQTKVFVGDKDFADRSIYTEKFPDAVLQICLYHVLVIFHREITTAKRQITADQKLRALEVIQRIVYSPSSAAYDAIYQELCDLDLEHVTDYFDMNWHSIREEWTLFGRNNYVNFLSSTNNRSERLNRTLKEIGNRYSNLLIFFENLSTSVAVISSEKDIKAVRSTMKLLRKRFDDPVLEQYNQFLTPFIFKKVEEQLELCNTVRIDLKRISATTFETQSKYIVTVESCSCTFFSSMRVPCRHIFKLLQREEQDLFVPSLCLERWTKQYYNESHPALSANEQRALPQPISVHRIRVPDEISKYKRALTVTKEINNLAASMSSSKYDYFMGRIEKLREEMGNNQNESVPEEVSEEYLANSTQRTDQQMLPLHASTPDVNVARPSMSSTQPNAVANRHPTSSDAASMPDVNVAPPLMSSTQPNSLANSTRRTDQQMLPFAASTPDVNVARPSMSSTQPNPVVNTYPTSSHAASMPAVNVAPPSMSSTQPNPFDLLDNMSPTSSSFAHQFLNRLFSMPDVHIPLSAAPSIPQQASSMQEVSPMPNSTNQRSDISAIKLLKKIVSIGRPKGSGLTVTGTKKKDILKKRKSTDPMTNVPAKRKFLDLNKEDQCLKIVSWLTNKSKTEILRKKVTYGDIIQDSNIFNRLRNDIDLKGVKKFVDKECFTYLSSEVNRLLDNDSIWGCTKCKRNLSGQQIMCNGCLDWYHSNCVNRQDKNVVPFFCGDCK